MIKKLQIFVSSTYKDLLVERQAAVQAILNAGHIPAGMELFAAGDQSQLEVIREWIDESDIFMLILGARYGSLDPETGKSYTQLEYEYAVEQGKPFFAVVLSDDAIDAKVDAEGRKVLEQDHPAPLKEFRGTVMSKICRIVDDEKDIKIAINETLHRMLRRHTFDGWVSGRDVGNPEKHLKEIAKLSQENGKLKAQAAKLKDEVRALKLPQKQAKAAEEEFYALMDVLERERVTRNYTDGREKVQDTRDLLDWFDWARVLLINGVSESAMSGSLERFLFYAIAPRLMVFGLTEHEKRTSRSPRIIKTTKKGNGFLAFLTKLYQGHFAEPEEDEEKEEVER